MQPAEVLAQSAFLQCSVDMDSWIYGYAPSQRQQNGDLDHKRQCEWRETVLKRRSIFYWRILIMKGGNFRKIFCVVCPEFFIELCWKFQYLGANRWRWFAHATTIWTINSYMQTDHRLVCYFGEFITWYWSLVWPACGYGNAAVIRD